MSRQQFTSRNNIGQVLTFQKSGSTPSFDPVVGFSSGSRRVSWRLDNGSNITQTAGNSLAGGSFYTGFTSDSGIRTIQMRGNSFRNMNRFELGSDNLYGHLNLSELTGLGGNFIVSSNPLLTGITHSPSSQNFAIYQVNTCNLTGILDISPLTNLGGANSSITSSVVRIFANSNLTNIVFPNSTQFFKNLANSEGNSAFDLLQNNLDYVDFTPLSGATLLSGTTEGNPRISLRNNGMSTTDVNHILVDFSGNATFNPTGWSNVNLNISGTNGAPDSGTGGYDGIAARNFLTGSPYNWTITHS